MNKVHPLHEYLKSRLSDTDQQVLDAYIFSLVERNTCLENAIDIDTEDARYQYQQEFLYEFADVAEAIRYAAFTSKLQAKDIHVWFYNDFGEDIEPRLAIEHPSSSMTFISSVVMLKQALVDFIELARIENKGITRIEFGIVGELDGTHSDCTGQLSIERVEAYLRGNGK